VIGQPLAMEGIFSFFLESSFLGLLLHGERRLGRIGHWVASFLVWLGSWLSGYFIVATDAWMQHLVAYSLGPSGAFELKSFWGLLLNPWPLRQYPHTILGALRSGCFLIATIGAFYLLAGQHEDYGRNSPVGQSRTSQYGKGSPILQSVSGSFSASNCRIEAPRNFC
jgi:cytochrome d ubiquinol oxidase subunit I